MATPSSTGSSALTKLTELRQLLRDLPASLPIPAQTSYPFVNYSPPDDLVELYGDIPSAINNTLETTFGFKARSEGDGILTITERGPGICAVVDVLELYQRSVRNPEDAILTKWIDDLRAGVEKAYRSAGVEPAVGRKRPRTETVSKNPQSVITVDSESDSGSEPEDRAPLKGIRRDDLARVPELFKKKTGRPKDAANVTLSIALVHKRTGKSYYGCVAEKCGWFRAGSAQRSRLLKHSTSCIYLAPELKMKAEDWSSVNSLGGKVGVLPDPDKAARDVSSAPSLATKRARLDDVPADHLASKQASLPLVSPGSSDDKLKQTTIDTGAVAAGRKELRSKLNHLVLKLICVRGLVPDLIDSTEWREFVLEATKGRYESASSTTFLTSYIPSEASHIRKLQYQRLQTLRNLTITFDGGTTRKPQSVYTVHITTIDRKVYFMEGHEASGESHTAEHIKDFLFTIMKRVGVERFCAVCSDNAGNTKKARALLKELTPTVLDIADCCHHLHNTAKDLTRLPEFKEVISQARKVLTYFKKSTLADTELTALRAEDGLIRGLESVGKTRFATVYWSLESVRRCLVQLRRIVASGRFTIKTFDRAILLPGTMSTLQFEQALTRYTSILAPVARAIKALESTNTTASDVLLFWLATASHLNHLLSQSENVTGISPELGQKVRGIVNARYKAFIDEAPNDIYFNTFYLDPQWASSDILRRTNLNPLAPMILIPRTRRTNADSDSSAKDDSEYAPNPRAYRRVKKFLKEQLKLELAVKPEARHPLLLEIGAKTAASELRTQLMAYARSEYPFNQSLEPFAHSAQPVLAWWQALADHHFARVLALLAIKFYAATVNSMADERTASNFTWYNTALRNRQDAKTLTDMIQVRQWYLNENESEPPRTHPVVRWSKLDKSILTSREKLPAPDNDIFEDWPEDAAPSHAAEAQAAEAQVPMASSFEFEDMSGLFDLSSAQLRGILADTDEEVVLNIHDAHEEGIRGSQTSTIHAADDSDTPDWDF